MGDAAVSTPLARPRSTGPWKSDDLDHYVCCDNDVALCGADVSDAEWSEDLPDLCVVCDDLDGFDCPRCGA